MMIKTGKQSQSKQTRIRLFLVIGVALGIIIGTVIWILNIENVIAGSWSNIFGVLFTTLGVLFALLQWHSGTPVQQDSPIVPSPMQKEHFLSENTPIFSVDDQKGALLVKTKKQFRGKTVHICRCFSTVHLKPDAAANITARRFGSQTLFVGIFPSLEPGNYTVYGDTRQYMAKVTVYAGKVAEVDWQ